MTQSKPIARPCTGTHLLIPTQEHLCNNHPLFFLKHHLSLLFWIIFISFHPCCEFSHIKNKQTNKTKQKTPLTLLLQSPPFLPLSLQQNSSEKLPTFTFSNFSSSHLCLAHSNQDFFSCHFIKTSYQDHPKHNAHTSHTI